MAIDKQSLSKIVEGIILKHKILRPVFEGAEIARYFQLTSAHLWAENDDKTIYSLIQMPMADMSDVNVVRIMSPANTIQTDLGIAVVNL